MIIRRRHTANFTTIGNALFEDDRASVLNNACGERVFDTLKDAEDE